MFFNGQNFGDYLSYIIVGEIKLKDELRRLNKRFLALGSILHFAKTGDTIWGSGINGKIPKSRFEFEDLDVRMVRGPLTKKILEEKGIKVSEIYGDPALLMPTLFPNFKRKPIKGKNIIIPNLNELRLLQNLKIPKDFKLISPLKHWKYVVNEILTSELVLASSLHGIIISEAFGVPVRFVMPSGGETLLKYEDYYLGTGRKLKREPSTFYNGIKKDMGLSMTPPKFNANIMLKSFPWDLFG
mgnify:FL=1